MLIVVDSVHPLVRQNRCFDPIYEYTGAGHAIHVRLAREARRKGMAAVTADVFLKENNISAKAVCLTDMVTPFTDTLLANGVMPAICMSLESPLNAKIFYHNIANYAGRFRHNFQFNGTRKRLDGTGTVFHPIVFPVETFVPLAAQSWDKRDYLIIVNGNKRAVFHKVGNLKEMMLTALSRVKFIASKAIDPWMRIRELYVDRVEAIYNFSRYSNISLYGIGWDKPIQGFSADYHKAALKVYKGIIPPDVRCKREVMNRFRFAICFENCAFPGYVTEKIFDCFLAGCIPVYFGAPDITDFVPADTFVDYRQFGNYSDLDKFLREMTESDARHYLDAAQDFLTSSAFDKYTVDYFVNDVLSIIEQEFIRKG